MGVAHAYEAATIASRLANRLECSTIVLVGCVRPELVAPLSHFSLIGFDEADHTSEIVAGTASGRWEPIEQLRAVVERLHDVFALISSSSFDALDAGTLRTLLAASPAALLHDVDGSAGTGPAALLQCVEGVRDRGFHVIRGELITPLGSTTHRRSSPAVLVSDGHDDRPVELVSTGLHGLRLDPAVRSPSVPRAKARVCIISYEVVGPSRNGGIGTANSSLALALGRAGHDVTLIYTGEPSDQTDYDEWIRYYGDRNVTLEQINHKPVAAVTSPFINVRRAWAVYERLRELNERRPFDVIHGPDCQGHMAFVVLAKRHRIDFGATELVVGVHSPTRWCCEANRLPLETLTGLADDYLEQTSVAHADAVISPSGYMLDYLRARGWALPQRSFVQQYTTSQAIHDLRASVGVAPNGTPHAPPSELVFFGRLEKRKGLEAFCDALDQLAYEPPSGDLQVTFMGSAVTIDGEPSVDYIRRRSEEWPWPVRVETSMSQPEAVRHLRAGQCLAVMPSLVDNSPNTVYEALALGIPLIVSRSGGTAELVAIEDLERCSFLGWPEDDVLDPAPADTAPRRFDDAALADLLRTALRETPSAVRPAVDPAENEACHVEWNASFAEFGPRTRQPGPLPTLSTILVTTEPNAVKSISTELAGTTNELILAFGDKTRLPVALPPAWLVLDTGRATVGQAHNVAANAAGGEWLLFLSEEVIPDGSLPERVRTAAESSTADVLLFPVRDVPLDDRDTGRVVVPAGGPSILALSHQFFGTSGFAIRADTLRALGGFSDTNRGGRPQDELLTRAAAAGLRIEVVPEVLGRRSTRDPLGAMMRDDVWPEAVPWTHDGEQRLGLLRPFLHSHTVADLPALYRSSQELLARVLADTRESWARSQQAYLELRAHAERVQTAYEDTRAHTERLQAANDAIQSSRSWKVTAPLRLAGRLRRLAK